MIFVVIFLGECSVLVKDEMHFIKPIITRNPETQSLKVKIFRYVNVENK